MTREVLVKAATDNQGYETPHLNDQLFLHFKGFRRIENLEPYSELKALWLESNGLLQIENLDHLAKLRCLYLQQNLISSIENLGGLVSLRILDLSQNRITILENLSDLPHLQTLNVSKNLLSNADALRELTHCTSLSSVDLSHNSLDGEEVIDVLAEVPNLVSTNMVGNAVANIPQFRKKMISRIRRLGYMDRPVFEGERLAAEAWAVGGREAEIEAREQFRAAQRKKEQDERRAFREWKQQKIEEHRLRREAQAQAQAGSVPPLQAEAKGVDHGDEEAGEAGEAGDEPPALHGVYSSESDRAEAEAAARDEAASVAGNGVQRLANEFWAGEETRKRLEEEARNSKKTPNLFGHMEAAAFRAPNLSHSAQGRAPSPRHEGNSSSSEVRQAGPERKGTAAEVEDAETGPGDIEQQVPPPADEEENLEPNGEHAQRSGSIEVAAGPGKPVASELATDGDGDKPSPEEPNVGSATLQERSEASQPATGQEDAPEAEADDEDAEEMERRRRVQESLERYRKDLKRRPRYKPEHDASSAGRVTDLPGVAAMGKEASDKGPQRTIWTEACDIQLATVLRQSNLNFAAAADAINQHSSSGTRPVSASDCQTRWEELSLGETMAVLAKIGPSTIVRPPPSAGSLEDLEREVQEQSFHSKYLQRPLPPSCIEDEDDHLPAPPAPVFSGLDQVLPPAAPSEEQEEAKHPAAQPGVPSSQDALPPALSAPAITDFDLLD